MAEPAMGHLLEDTVLKLNPAEVPQRSALGILAVARNTGRIEVGGSRTVPAETLPLPLAPFQAVMHVAKDH